MKETRICKCGSLFVAEVHPSTKPSHRRHCSFKCGHSVRKKVTRGDGYVVIKRLGHTRADKQGYVFEHVLIAEKALGRPIPATVDVHHFNENKSDNTNQNLVICEDRKYHSLLHARMRVLQAGGDPNTDKICSRCKHVKARTAFGACRSTWDGLAPQCRRCSRRLNNLYRSGGNVIKNQIKQNYL